MSNLTRFLLSSLNESSLTIEKLYEAYLPMNKTKEQWIKTAILQDAIMNCTSYGETDIVCKSYPNISHVVQEDQLMIPNLTGNRIYHEKS